MTKEESEVFVGWMDKKSLYVNSKGVVRNSGNRPVSLSNLVSMWSGDEKLIDGYFKVDEGEVRSLVQELASAVF